MGKKKHRTKVLLNGRPPMSGKQQASLSKKATRTLIRSHHQLSKQVAAAEAKGDNLKADELKKSIEDQGGLKSYQAASIQGQAHERGGDSSTFLVEWLQGIKPEILASNLKLRMLEVGALSTNNACSESKLFEVERIDLNSQSQAIKQQDFMKRPTPNFGNEQFDIISLSLVLNFVPEPAVRGEMLKRTCQFLDQRAPRSMAISLQATFPALFLVLPAACITNSRYMNEERLTLLMASLGYVLLKRKQTTKLIYYMWHLRDKPMPDEQSFPKAEVNPGPSRNNFSILLRK